MGSDLKDRQIFCAEYQEQLAALKGEIEKLRDPRFMDAQWKLFAAMEARNKELIAQVAQREGILQELEKWVQDLRNDLAQQIQAQKKCNRAFAGNNAELTRSLEMLSQQISALDQIGQHYFKTPLRTCATDARQELATTFGSFPRSQAQA